MNEEDLKEAKRLAEVYEASGSGNAYHGIITGYAAACESKNPRIEELEKQISDIYDAQNG